LTYKEAEINKSIKIERITTAKAVKLIKQETFEFLPSEMR
jgi:hypothetical protein